MTTDPDGLDGSLVAVIGASGRFPGARTLRELWQNLSRGVESVRFFTEEELLAAGEAPEVIRDPSYVRAWPVLDDIELFDAGFFGMSPRDASVMDPQHRFFLEVTWEAMEDAGYDPERIRGPVGVFATCGMNTYMMHHLVPNPEVMRTVGEWLVRHTGNDMNFLATRVSYQMNLKGPSMNVQTACSSSLVALHLACQSLQSGECDMALAGASAMALPQDRGYLFKQGEILSPDGHCRPFDAGSRGTLFGSGTAAVVLKRLADARRDGDRLLGIIRGSAVNNDGSLKIGYLAPGVDGQERAVTEAIALSGVPADSISFIEAHGTGTAIGDPIEITALSRAFAAYTDRRQFCAIGSIKANIGHLGEAAGMAGLVKTLLALEHRQIPPTINYDRPNPEIDFAASPVFVNTELVPWRSDGPRRAGITSLGAGGTNAHVIVEEAPAREPSGPSRRVELLVWSARTETALEAATDRLAAFLRESPGTPLADVAYTLQVGRKAHAHRRLLVCESAADAAAALAARDPKRLFQHGSTRSAPQVVFLFPGGGSQYAGMGEELYRTEPAYRAAFDACLASLDPAVAGDLRRLVLESGADADAAGALLERPTLSVCSVFVTAYATARLLLSWGVEPVAMVGHSMGEYVAACLSSVLSLEDALALLLVRGRIFEKLPPGAMLSVPLPEEETRSLLGAELSLAAVNAPGMCVASGPVHAIDALERSLAARDLESTRIRIGVAAHSAMLEPFLPELESALRRIRLSPPTLPFVSNLTGTWITAEDATDPRYWVRHLRGTVRFGDGITEVLRGGERVLVEVGPGRTLSSLARQRPSPPVALPTLRHPKEPVSDVAFLLQTLGRLWAHGTQPDFDRFHEHERRHRVALPPYPFERQRYWVDRGDPAAAAPTEKTQSALRKKPDVGSWFHLPSWRRSIATPGPASEGPWLVFMDGAGVGARLAAELPGRTIRVAPGWAFHRTSEVEYTIRPGSAADYVGLLEALEGRGLSPKHIVHLFAVLPAQRLSLGAPSPWTDVSRFDSQRELCFDSLLCLGKALGEREAQVLLTVVSNELLAVGDEPVRAPSRALLVGPTRVIPREMPFVRTRHVDLHLAPGRRGVEAAARSLALELAADTTDAVVAHRGTERWVRAYDPVALPPASASSPGVRRGAVVLVTGGLGGIGLEVGGHFARVAGARLVLVGRSPLPPEADWGEWLSAHGEGDRTSQRIRKLQSIRALGGEVLTVAADVTDRAQMEDAVARARARFGRIDGVVHAAGVIDDGLIALKTKEAAAAVIAAKAKGALLLRALLAGAPLDFFVVFSSVSSILGLEGQVDYTAANAFLDAFAHQLARTGDTRAISIDWNAWQEVGMAVALADRAAPSGGASSQRGGTHPLLARTDSDSRERTVLSTPFSRAQHWVLSEHVVRGADALIPGTGFLELARAAFSLRADGRPVELRDVFFLAPFAVKVGETRDLSIELRWTGSHAAEFRCLSEQPDAPHVTGRVAAVDAPPPAAVSLDALSARCNVRRRELRGFLDQPFVDFGPRWGCVQGIATGDGEALVRLELPPEYEDELATYRLHPALLDMATGAAQSLVPGFDQVTDFYVPFSYGRLLVRSGLPPKLWSHVRLKPTAAKGFIAFDVRLYGDDGVEVASIADFVMKRVERASDLQGDRARGAAGAGNVSRLGAVVHQGILPAEGMDALTRILASNVDRQVVACSVDLDGWFAAADAEARARAPGAAEEAAATEGFDRPTLTTTYVAPRDAVEEEIARMWRELLGVKEVGVHDDFFELGGQSLVAVRFFNKVRKKYGVDLPLSTLFEAPTVAECAAVVRQEAGIAAPAEAPESGTSAEPSEGSAATDAATAEPARPAAKRRWASLVPMQPKGSAPPFYCVAGMGGTLNNLRHLALLLGDGRPVYGLQPPGAQSGTERLYEVEALATHYIAEVRSVQPHGPYFLGGYSGGGVAAFEMAKQLSAAGEEVAFLGFLDSFSPQLPLRPLWSRAKIHLERVQKQGPGYVLATARRRMDHDSRVLELRLKRELARVFPHRYRYEALQDSWTVAEGRYCPTPWTGKATLFRAREETAHSLWTAFEVDDRHGWGRYLEEGVDLVLCPGDHTTMCEEPHVRVLAQKVREAIAQAAAAHLAPAVPLSASARPAHGP